MNLAPASVVALPVVALVVLVKPNGLLGTVYMAAIKPFRHLIVYPAIMREI